MPNWVTYPERILHCENQQVPQIQSHRFDRKFMNVMQEEVIKARSRLPLIATSSKATQDLMWNLEIPIYAQVGYNSPFPFLPFSHQPSAYQPFCI